MEEFKKNKSLMNGKGENDIEWITVNGSHVPIKAGQSKKQAIEDQFSSTEFKQEKIEAIKPLIDTLKKIKKIKTKELINYIKNLNPIKLQTNDKEIIAQFDLHTAKENIFGDKISDKEGYNFKIKNIDNMPKYIENAKYSYSSKDSGKNIKTHKGVKEWHYFVNKVQTEKGEYNVNVNIRDKGDSQFIYLVTFKKK